MNNNRGFTLIEILASIVILGIILTVFFQVFILSQKATTANEDKLVAISLAEKVLERMVNPGTGDGYQNDIRNNDEFKQQTSNVIYIGIEDCGEDGNCIKRYSFLVKEKNYVIKLAVYPEHDDMGLYPVKVQVYGEEEKMISEVKGLVEL